MVDDEMHDILLVYNCEKDKHVLEQNNARASDPVQGTREAVTLFVILKAFI